MDGQKDQMARLKENRFYNEEMDGTPSWLNNLAAAMLSGEGMTIIALTGLAVAVLYFAVLG